MPWRSGGRAWVREGPHPSCASGVHSGEQERNPCSGAPSAESLPPPPSAAPLLSSSSPSCHLSCPQIRDPSRFPRDPSRFPPCSALSFPLPSFISHSVAPSATPLPHVTHRALRVPGPRLGPLSSGQVTFFPNHSHEDPGRLEGLSLAAEIPPSEAIRFGAQGGLQEDGTGARVGHRGEERERSALCGLRSYMHPVVVARNAGPEEGSQEEVGGTDHPAVSSGAWGGDAEGMRSRVGGSVTRLLTPTRVGPPPPGSSVASSCATNPVAPRTPSSWITCAPLFCSTCGGSCPGISWTLPGPRPHLPCVRSVGPPS